MNRRDALTLGGAVAVVSLPEIYPAHAEPGKGVNDPIPSRLEYRFVDYHLGGGRLDNLNDKSTQLVDEGFELIAFIQFGEAIQYVFGKRVPLDASA